MPDTMQVKQQGDRSEPAAGGPCSARVVLVVDLDGTLLETDLLQETTLRLVRQRPWALLLIPFWLLRGRAYLKRRISEHVNLDCTSLPMNEALVEWLRSQKAASRRLV